MWYHSDPDERLYMARVKQRELLAEARASRRSHKSSDRPIRTEQVRGIRLHLGRILIVIGRTIYDEDRPCPDLAA